VYELQWTPAAAAAAGKWTETVLYSFTGQNGHGANGWSHAVPVVDANGNIYGTTTSGGTYFSGTVFELQPPVSGGTWTETLLYSFTDGFGYSNVVIGANGTLYGVNSAGGAYGQGMVFELTPPSPGEHASGGTWTANVLYSFTGAGDGSNPAGLTIGPDGILYGTASGGGTVGEGVVFELRPPSKTGGVWIENVLCSFIGGEAGGNPFGPLVVNGDGSLYGTTASSVFQLTPPAPGGAAPGASWTQTIVHNFWGDAFGGPDSALVVHDGVIYGTISSLLCICTCSGGAVFEVRQQGSGAWNETILHRFYGNSEPFGTLVMDENEGLFGTTLFGPGNAGAGILYKIDPSSAGPEASDENDSTLSICDGARLTGLVGRRP
jgi:uncharacterized repeat protein (TIGR03803 family)